MWEITLILPTIDPVSDAIIEKKSGNHTIQLTGIGDGERLNPDNILLITDKKGRVLFTEDVNETSEYKLEVGKYAKGIYFVCLTHGKDNHFAKFVVE